MTSKESIIAVDWGSTNLLATHIVEGRVLDQKSAPLGIRQLQGRDFEAVLREVCADWLDDESRPRFLLSGMVGSREGWIEIPYVDTPAGPDEIEAELNWFETGLGEVAIVPGVRHLEEDGVADVMRGEETQVIGALEKTGPDATFCIPGTHSKWIQCREGRIESFRTWVTGEAFELLSASPLLAKGGAANPGSDAFLRGLDHARRDGGVLRQIFLGRTDMLMGKVPAAELPSLLSGILVGAELREAPKADLVTLLGSSDRVLAFYQRAFDHFAIHQQLLVKEFTPHVAGALSLIA
ncbi:MAG: 2-dehydro-3-deoxygalactonokinase [Verrucomicrobiota bacterium]